MLTTAQATPMVSRGCPAPQLPPEILGVPSEAGPGSSPAMDSYHLLSSLLKFVSSLRRGLPVQPRLASNWPSFCLRVAQWSGCHSGRGALQGLETLAFVPSTKEDSLRRQQLG